MGTIPQYLVPINREPYKGKIFLITTNSNGLILPIIIYSITSRFLRSLTQQLYTCSHLRLAFRVWPGFHFICERKCHGSPFLGIVPKYWGMVPTYWGIPYEFLMRHAGGGGGGGGLLSTSYLMALVLCFLNYSLRSWSRLWASRHFTKYDKYQPLCTLFSVAIKYDYKRTSAWENAHMFPTCQWNRPAMYILV